MELAAILFDNIFRLYDELPIWFFVEPLRIKFSFVLCETFCLLLEAWLFQSFGGGIINLLYNSSPCFLLQNETIFLSCGIPYVSTAWQHPYSKVGGVQQHKLGRHHGYPVQLVNDEADYLCEPHILLRYLIFLFFHWD